MRLRSRLAAVTALLLVATVGAGWAVLRIHASAQTAQLDQRLQAVIPNIIRFADTPGPPPPTDGSRPEDSNDPFSDVYVARIAADGTREVVVRAGSTTQDPNIPTRAASPLTRGASFRPLVETVLSQGSDTKWRATLVAGPDGTHTVLVAISRDGVDETARKLLLALLAAGLVVFAILTLAGWWIVRLGLQPINRVTEAAGEILAGNRDARVPLVPNGTEAADLAKAFNVMLDEHQASETLLRRFVSDASHELRTPVASIRGFTDLYRAGALAEPAQVNDAMRRIGAESRRMSLLVDDLLLLARLDEGQRLERGPVDLATVLHDSTLDASATHPSRTVSVDIEGDVIVVGDESRLRQVVANLVTNALAHGEGNVELAARRSDAVCVITVTDQGPGMDHDQVARAFDRFWRSDASRARRGSGSGLGLSISAAIVEAHGGRIAMTSARGTGTTITVELPTFS